MSRLAFVGIGTFGRARQVVMWDVCDCKRNEAISNFRMEVASFAFVWNEYDDAIFSRRLFCKRRCSVGWEQMLQWWWLVTLAMLARNVYVGGVSVLHYYGEQIVALFAPRMRQPHHAL